MLVRERFPDLLEPYLYKVYELVVEKGDDYVSKIFTVGTSDKNKEPVSGIGAADMPRPWAGQVTYSDVSPLWRKEYVHTKYSTGLRFERELFDDAQWPEIKNRTNAVMLSLHRFRQLHAHAIFNAAFTGSTAVGFETVSLLGPDGQYLCDTDHPLAPDNAATQSNKLTLPLTVDNLETARLTMMNLTDDKGKPLLVIPDTLIVPPGLEKTAQEIVYSVGRPDTADRADNVRRNAYEVLTLPLLTTSNAWFLVDSKMMKQYCLWFDRRKGVPERQEDFNTEVISYKVVMRMSYGFHHYAWIVGSLPS